MVSHQTHQTDDLNKLSLLELLRLVNDHKKLQDMKQAWQVKIRQNEMFSFTRINKQQVR